MYTDEDKRKIQNVKNLEQKGELNEALKICESLTKENESNYFVLNLHGYILLKLNNFKISKKFLTKSIELNEKFAASHYLLGINNYNLNQLEESLENFIKAISLNPNIIDAHINIINMLSSFEPKKNLKHPYILVNSLIEKTKFEYNEGLLIDNIKVKNFLNKSINIIEQNFKNISYPKTQIYRHTSENLNCERHFKVFNKFNVIPEFCFSCFKIVIELKNVLDLFKLYFVFDNFNDGLQYSRKVMIETRKDIPGKYKGFIYCKTIEEANYIKDKVDKIVRKNIGDNFLITAKRGCTEFGIKYPDYKKINPLNNKMMSYKKEWKDFEYLIDNKIYNDNSQKSMIYRSLKGPKLNDILIMKNWLIFAKKNSDRSIEI